ncbi:MAG: family 78 glycoside hydrolase catalytic domain, partial [Chloroflexota bacterium]
MKKYTLLIAAILLQFCSNRHCDITVGDLKCNNLVNPAGTSGSPALSWINSSDIRGASQTAYQVILDKDPASLKNESECMWTTGKVVSASSFGLNPEFSFRPATRYYWKVRTWDQNGMPSNWSETSTFLTGLFTEADWGSSAWIGYEDMPDSLRLVPGIHGSGNNLGEIAKKRSIIPYFRREFTAAKKIRNAYLFISGLGQYELYVNGRKADDRFLAPGWTDYDKTCYYNSYDITSQLKKGQNTIGVIAGNGFYNINRERYRKLVIAYGEPKMIARLVINYDDGTTGAIVSDDSWLTSPSPVTFTSIYGGEDYDASLEQEGWSSPGLMAGNWKKAVIVKRPSGTLRAESGHPLKVMQEFAPEKITRVNDTSFIYDFGQNCSGIINLKIKGEAGRTTRLWPAELLDKDSLANQKASGYPYYWSYKTSGKGIEEWRPRFTYYGFRYVQVSGAVPKGEPNPGNLPVISELKLLHTRNSSPQTGSFKCSNEHFNKIYTLIDWAIKSNLASVATDCPHREKLGWLEQTHLMGNSMSYAYDIHNLYGKIVDDMIESQLDNGLVPDIAPEFVEFVSGFRDSPEWGSACVIVPYDLYKWYGDVEAVEKAWPMMIDYISYLNILAPEGILRHGLGDWYDLGPRFPGEAQLTPRSVTATSIYYYDVKLMSEMAAVLGREGDMIYYKDLAAQIKTAFNTEFYDPEKGIYSLGSQTAFAMPLFFGMVEDSCRSRVVANLVTSIKANGNSLTAGDIGYRYLLRALEQEGQSQLIFDMNSKTDVPGYGYQLSKGATSLTESWAGLTEVSNNHMMLGHLMEWFYSGIGGIRQDESSKAYEHIVIAPQPAGDITSAETTCTSVQGTISTSWKISGSGMDLKVRIPVGSMATIVIP